METSQCHASPVNSFIHHLYTKDSSRNDQWTPQLDTHKKPAFRSRHSTYIDSLSPACWSSEEFTKHGHSNYSHSLLPPTLEQAQLCEPSTGDDLSASWSSSNTSRSSLPSPDLDDRRHNGWLADFYVHSSSSPPPPPTISQQRISPAPTFLEQQPCTTRYTYHSRPNIPAVSTPHTHQAATTQEKMKNWEMAFDWYENDKHSYNNSTMSMTPTTVHNKRSSTQVDHNTCSLENDLSLKMENEINDTLKGLGHDTRLEEKESSSSSTRQVSDQDTRLNEEEETTAMDAASWNKIGMELQETEQDGAAIDAFQRALDLDVNMLDAWLNLAISYTNEHQRGNAYDCLEAWLRHNDKYQHIFKMDYDDDDTTTVMKDRNTVLVERFILAARCAPGDTLDSASSSLGSPSPSSISIPDTATKTILPLTTTNGIDADVQVILGLLFYLADETQKSTDCFRAALACRPDDHRLWNQLGSVILSQQGMRVLETSSCGDAMDMYWSALYLNPVYTRARYNLAVAHMKLAQYEQAAHHLVIALTHQQKQQQQQRKQRQRSSVKMISNSSSSMWSSLRLVMYMLNLDHLAEACNRYDLAPLVSLFGNPCTSTPHTQ